MSLAPKISDVAKTLRAAGMDDTSMTHVLKALAVAGHVDLENGKSPAAVQAAVQASAGSSHPRLRTPAEVAENDQALPLLRQLNHATRRYNLSAFKTPKNTSTLSSYSASLNSSQASTEEKIRVKTQMAMVGLLI